MVNVSNFFLWFPFWCFADIVNLPYRYQGMMVELEPAPLAPSSMLVVLGNLELQKHTRLLFDILEITRAVDSFDSLCKGCICYLSIDDVSQTLIENGLRERVILRVDGGFKSGVDVLMAAAMGADEYGFGSVAMIATGCVMARICHTNNCPVGVASQVGLIW